jgi:putative ABC transport system permease protein
LATGAARADILRLVLREAAALSFVGLAVGLPTAVAASRVVRSMIEGAGTDSWTYAAAAAVLVVTVLAASYLPARRAARLDPQRALRYE